MKLRLTCSALALTGVLAGFSTPSLADTKPAAPAARPVLGFGSLRAPAREVVQDQARAWLKSVNKFDETSFNKIWADGERPTLDLVAETFALGNPAVNQLLTDAANPDLPAPVQVPDLIKDTKLPVFFRANLAVAYAKALTSRKVYEESLEALKTVKAEQVVDPAAYYFHKAVCEHGMLIKGEAGKTITHLMDDVPDAPERYKMVAALMYLDMQQWKDKDLGDIGRKMNNIERRLELARGGPQTQKMQKEVVMRLDELIKKLENQQKQQQQQQQEGKDGKDGKGEPGCPPGGQPGSQPGDGPPGNTNQPSSPMNDSNIATNGGPGNVDPRKLKEMVEAWGKLPEKERAKAMTGMIQSMPPAYRQMIEDYYRKVATAGSQLP